MTVTTIASIAAGLSRTSQNPSAKAASLFSSLLTPARQDAGGDSAKLSAAVALQNQVAQFRVASQNIAQAGSLLATAEAGAGAIIDGLDQLAALAKRASNATSDAERATLQSQFATVRGRIDTKAKSASFNNEKLLDGSSPQLKLASENKDIKNLSIGSLTDQALFKGAALDISTKASAADAEKLIKDAKAYATKQRENIKALEKGLDFASSTLQTAIQNNEAARSTFDDGDLVSQLLGGKPAAGNDTASLLAQTRRLPGGILQLLSE